VSVNRRGFFKALAATAVVAFASQTRLAQTALRAVEPDWEKIGWMYAEALARSMIETKEALVNNLLNNTFNPNQYTHVSYGFAAMVTEAEKSLE
jgi:hypothetical protein